MARTPDERVGRDRAADDDGILSASQREILQLISDGRSSKEMVQQLDPSVKTVENGMELIERLGIHRIAGLVRYAISAGIVYLESWGVGWLSSNPRSFRFSIRSWRAGSESSCRGATSS